VAAAYRQGNREPRRVRLGMTFTDEVAPGVGREETTRGRSFLFIALAAMAGSGLGTMVFYLGRISKLSTMACS